ncbi:MAG: SRPBCC family protein [Candidatus Limnocylindria bacterium]
MATELLRREFTVEAPLASAWQAVADVADWPRWAPHIRHLTVTPPGLIGPASTGSLWFRPLGRSRFQISSYDEGVRWEWVGNVLWLRIRYEHRFAADGDRTQMTWTVSEDRSGRSVLGRSFAWFYARLVDRAIPRLQAQLASSARGG